MTIFCMTVTCSPTVSTEWMIASSFSFTSFNSFSCVFIIDSFLSLRISTFSVVLASLSVDSQILLLMSLVVRSLEILIQIAMTDKTIEVIVLAKET